MTTAEIEGYANEEGLVIGSSDINLKVRLRRKVIPKWEMDVGECAWRRKNTTLSVVANDREYDLPADFGKMLDLPEWRDSSRTVRRLRYIGEDTSAMAEAESSTTPGSPAGYYFSRVTGPPTALRAIKFDVIPSASFTLYYSYLSEIQFADLTTAVELDNYMPTKFQWALVEALKMEIYKGRISINDQRLVSAIEEYQSYKNDAIDYREPGMREESKRIVTGPL